MDTWTNGIELKTLTLIHTHRNTSFLTKNSHNISLKRQISTDPVLWEHTSRRPVDLRIQALSGPLAS